MIKTGIEIPKLPETGIDAEQLKAHLKYHTDTNKLEKEFKEKLFEKIFSPHFFVFLITLLIITSGFVFMLRDGALKEDIIDYWKLILPIVTTYIGYAIGKGKSN